MGGGIYIGEWGLCSGLGLRVRVYWKPTCQTCRRVVNVLRGGISELEVVNLVENPPSSNILERLAARYGARNLLRRRSKYYNAEKFERMADDEIIGEMLKNPDLIKRPIVVVGENVVVGDDREALSRIMGGSNRSKSRSRR
ncbi:MAG: ArsC/Spx/MgsR family protein [Nitrososphaerota archaeon]